MSYYDRLTFLINFSIQKPFEIRQVECPSTTIYDARNYRHTEWKGIKDAIPPCFSVSVSQLPENLGRSSRADKIAENSMNVARIRSYHAPISMIWLLS